MLYYPQVTHNISGNTQGATGNIYSGTYYLAGGNNITLSQNQNTVTIIGAAGGTGGGAADGYNLIAAGTQTAQSTGTVAFVNSNGMTFGMSNSSQVTASYTVPSTAGLLSAINLSAGSTSQNLSKVTFDNSNGVSFGLNGSVITASHNALTTAMASNAGSQFIYSSAAKNLTNISATFGSDAVSLSVGNYITTARASDDAIGLNTAKTNVTWTVNSNGISLDAGGYAGIGTSATNASITLNSNGLAISVNAGGAGDGYNILAAGTQTANTTGSVNFANSNGITFGMSNNSQITASHNGLTQQSTQPVAASASNGSFNFSTLKFIESNGVTWATSTDGIRASVKTDYQSSNANYLTSQSNQALSAANGSFTFQTATFANSNGISFSTGTQGIYASHNGLTTAMASDAGSRFLNIGTTNGTNISITLASNNLALSVGNYLTTARASTDALGLNTAGSNMTWTANSSGLSIDARGYAGTGSTFNGTNVSGSMTLNSNGLRIDLSAGAGGGVNPAASASNGSFAFTTLNFSNANNVTFGTSLGGIITASVAAPGAAAENNWINLLGANTAGNTSASGSTIGVSGINLTLSGTNGSVWNISAPATSSLSATGLVSLSTNGSTISIGVADKTIYQWQPYRLGLSSLTSIGVSSIYFCPLLPEENVSMDWVEQIWSNSVSTSAANQWSRSMTFNYGVYSLNGSTISLISSSSVGMSMTASSNASKAFTYGNGANTVQFTTAGVSHPAWDVQKVVRLPFSFSMSAGGEYFWAQQISTASGGANVNASWSQLFNAEVTQASYALLEWTATRASTRFFVMEPYGFIRSATSGGLPSSMATTDASIYSNYQPYLVFEKHT